MRDGYPYERFLTFKMDWVETLNFWLLQTRSHLTTFGRNFYLNRLGGAKIEEGKHFPFAQYNEDLAMPALPRSPIGARTRHGQAIVGWWWSTTLEPTGGGAARWITTARPRNVENALLPDGTRGDVRNAMSGWRRPSTGPRLWLWGEVEITKDDVVFRDRPTQPVYQGPNADASPLERALAGCDAFVAAVADDDFARIAYAMLTQIEWMKIGNRDARTFRSNGDVAGFIADVREKGEEYLDYEYAGWGKEITKETQARHSLRLREILQSLGWRTYSSDELAAMAAESFKNRLARRLAAWNAFDELDQRPADSHPKIEATLLVSDMLMYEGEDERWLDDLTEAERAAASTQFPRRLLALAQEGKLTDEEYHDLREALL